MGVPKSERRQLFSGEWLAGVWESLQLVVVITSEQRGKRAPAMSNQPARRFRLPDSVCGTSLPSLGRRSDAMELGPVRGRTKV